MLRIVGIIRRRRSLTCPARGPVYNPGLNGGTAPGPGMRIVSDITYLPADGSAVSGLLDGPGHPGDDRLVDGRGPPGRARDRRDALRMAAGRGYLEAACVAHSDKGSEGGCNGSSQHRLLI